MPMLLPMRLAPAMTTTTLMSGDGRIAVVSAPDAPLLPHMYGPRPDGSCTYPPGIPGTAYRHVLLTETDPRHDGSVYGHRRPDGSHYNTIANRRCVQCVMESELSYLRTTWRASLPRRRRG